MSGGIGLGELKNISGIREITALMRDPNGIAELLTEEHPETGDSPADIVNTTRADNRRLGEPLGVEIDAAMMTSERAADLLAGTVGGDGIELVLMFNELSDQRDALLKEVLDPDERGVSRTKTRVHAHPLRGGVMARVVVIGQSGTGKSYDTGALLEQTVPAFSLAIHYDIEDEERGLSDARSDPIYRTLSVSPEKAQRFNWIRGVGNHRKLRVVPQEMTVDEMQELYAVICECVLKLCKELVPNWTGFVSCDEAHNLVPQNGFDSRVERLITGGRKHGVECLHISQRPQLLHTTVISQADRRIYFRVNDDNDLGKINRQSSFPAQKLRDLDDRVCLVENKSTGEFKRISTEAVNRRRPHYSQDDGIVDEHLPV